MAELLHLNYPLLFEPIYQDYVWGPTAAASRLVRRFRRSLPSNFSRIAESWEVADIPGQWESIIRNGPLAGRTLRELVTSFSQQLFGPIGGSSSVASVFPIIVKFLDVEDKLSVQVHPDDDFAAVVGFPGQGKHELWVILEAEPSAKLWAGFRRPVSEEELGKSLGTARLVELLNERTPKAGECYYFPPGTVHAAGGGLLVAEVQQASLLTFRLYDWDRTDSAGLRRPLHLREGLQAISRNQEPVVPKALDTDEGTSLATTVVDCPKFVVCHWRAAQEQVVRVGDSFKLLVAVAGEAELLGGEWELKISPGDVALIPWAVQEVSIKPLSGGHFEFLEISPRF